MTIALLSLLGCCWGSFVAACLSRLPRLLQGSISWHTFLLQASHCDRCHRRLTWLQLIPIVSYCYLAGRCAYCQAQLPKQLLLLEISSSLIFAGTALAVKSTVLPLILLLTAILLLLALLDSYYLLLPDCLTLPMLFFGLGCSYYHWSINSLDEALLSILIAFSLLWIPAKWYQHRHQQAGLGGGDIKLLMALACYLPYSQLSWLLILAGVIMLLYYWLIKQFQQRRLQQLPYGFALSLGGWLLLLYNYP